MVYVVILIIVWGLRTVTEARSGPFTAEQIRVRSEPICRLFDAPSEAASWLTDAGAVYGPGGVRQRLWSVDCTGPMDRWGRMHGAVVRWDADTGDLELVSHGGMPLNATASEFGPELTTDRAILISYHWLERLSLAQPGDPWVQDGPPNKESRSWQVRWRNRTHVCLIKINVFSGDLVLLQIHRREFTRSEQSRRGRRFYRTGQENHSILVLSAPGVLGGTYLRVNQVTCAIDSFALPDGFAGNISLPDECYFGIDGNPTW